jgi:hypothetical protein
MNRSIEISGRAAESGTWPKKSSMQGRIPIWHGVFCMEDF